MNKENAPEKLKNPLSKLQDKEKGASLVEYALLVALIAVLCIAAIRVVGQSVSAQFSSVAETMAPPPAP